MRDLEFRFNILIWTVMNLVWFVLVIAFVYLIFGQVDAIAGWKKNEVLLLSFVQTLFFSFMWTFVINNLVNFSRLIRHGDFDFVLLKPVSPRFFVSARFIDSDHYLRMMIIVFLIFRLLGQMGVHLTIINLISFWILLFLGIFIFYNLFFIIAVTSFWFIYLFNLSDLFAEIIDVSRAPVYIFQGGLRTFFIYVVPVAFIATFPVQALLDKAGPERIILAVVISLAMFAVSQWFWNFALKHYQSASS